MARETMGTNIPQSTIQQAQAGQVQNGGKPGLVPTIKGILSAWFGPQNPIASTAPADVKGRTWAYTPGYNLLTGSRRPLEPLSFQDLRMLARNLDLCTLAIETRKDQMETIEWEFRVKGQKKRSKDAPDPRIKELEDFFAFPDKDAGLSFKRWQRKLNDDILILDQPVIHKVLDKRGKPYAFRIIDGATMKLLVDEKGMAPLAPNPRYQQWLYGAPVGTFTADEMAIIPRNPRPDKLFGFSPVEQIYVTANIAIRKQLLNLAKYTEGNIPEAMVSCPPEWTAEQIAQFQVYFDSMLTANYGQQSKMRFMPAGIDKAVFPKNFDNADAYDLFLGKIICYAFSLPNTWLEQKSTRANAEQTQDAAMAEGLMPYLQYWSELWDYMIAWGFGYTDIECVPKHQREVDVLKQAQADEIRTRNGHLSVDEVRADLGENEIGQPPAVFVPATGYVTIGTEGKDEAAEVAEQAPDAEGGKPATPNADAQKPTGEEIAPPDRAVKMNKAENAGKKKLKMLPMMGHQKAERHLTEALTKFFKKEGRRVAGVMTKADEPTLVWKDLIPVFEPQLASVGKRGALQALAQVSVTDEKITNSVSDEAMTYAKERAGELVGMRWNGSEWIENPDAKWAITDSTRDMVRAVVDAGTKEQLSTDALAARIMESTAFSPERAAMIARTELAFAHTQGSLSGWKGSGVVTGKESILSQDHTGDDECDQAADDGEVPIGAPFSTGDDGPPYHPNCECALLAVLGEEDENTPADF